MRKWVLLLALLAAAGLVSACSGTSSGSGADPAGAARAVEKYLQGVITGDANQVAALVCAKWEADARTEAESFESVAAKLDNVTCEVTGPDGNDTAVACKGNIVATYNNEAQSLSVADRTYLAAQEGGEWRMCGYKP